MSSVAVAQQGVLKGFDTFNLTQNKTVNQSNQFWTLAPSVTDFDSQAFDFLNPSNKGYSVQFNENNVLGDELIMGMKFSDLLSVRLNILDGNQPLSIFSSGVKTPTAADDFSGYQFGVSSVVNLGSDWRLGFDLGKGQMTGDMLGLYQDNINTTSLGLGVRYNKFGATFNTDFYNRASDDLLEQSTLDLKVDWHFAKDGTISFGARKNVREHSESVDSILDQMTGTVPYIKFKHNL